MELDVRTLTIIACGLIGLAGAVVMLWGGGKAAFSFLARKASSIGLIPDASEPTKKSVVIELMGVQERAATLKNSAGDKHLNDAIKAYLDARVSG